MRNVLVLIKRINMAMDIYDNSQVTRKCSPVMIRGFIIIIIIAFILLFFLVQQKTDFGNRNQIHLNFIENNITTYKIYTSLSYKHYSVTANPLNTGVQSVVKKINQNNRVNNSVKHLNNNTLKNTTNDIQNGIMSPSTTGYVKNFNKNIRKNITNEIHNGINIPTTTGHVKNLDKNILKTKIGIMIPSTTRRLINPTLENLSLTNLCLPSIYKTLEQKYNYVIYIGIDKGDYLETIKDKLEKFNKVKVVLSSGQTFTKSINTVARKAYEDGMEYLVRINDDSSFETMEWSSKGIAVLQSYIPKNIGVVGPTCFEGNVGILTHDMVHRTHLEIFDFYYPPFFDNWWIDDWITNVYSPSRTTKLPTWVMKHHMNTHGTRYNVDLKKYAKLKNILQFDKKRLNEYISNLKQ